MDKSNALVSKFKIFPHFLALGLARVPNNTNLCDFSLLDYLMKFFDFKVIKYQGRKGALIHQLGR